MSIMDAEAGVCSGRVDQHHPLCIVNEPYPNHMPHLVDIRHHRRRMQCKDIFDEDFMTAVETAGVLYGGWANRWDVAAILSGNIQDVGSLHPRKYESMPAKVVIAKARKMIKKGLIQGCACGCRGDFELTQLANKE